MFRLFSNGYKQKTVGCQMLMQGFDGVLDFFEAISQTCVLSCLAFSSVICGKKEREGLVF